MIKIFKLSLLVMVALIFCPLSNAYSQKTDTLKLTITQVEAKFLQNNYLLIASKYNIEASKAAIIQAKLWSNPNLAMEQNIYNKDTKKWFDVTKTGNTELQIQQLFLVAGKRNKQVNLAEIGTKISEYQFYDLMRTLKYSLRSEYFDLFYLQKSLEFYDESINWVRKTYEATAAIYEKRSVLLSDLLRVKSLLFSLQSERLDIINQILGIQGDLRVLTGDSVSIGMNYIIPVVDEQKIENISIDNLILKDLIAYAMENRPDLKIAELSIKQQETNLELQRALAYPDITLGGRYSRAGSYITDYLALSVSIDLPFFNRNQGNIESAKINIEQYTAQKYSTIQTINKEISSAYYKAYETEKNFKTFDKKFTEDYKSLVASMVTNYENKNLSVIQYTDFFESYRTSMLQFNKLKSNRLDALEAINYTVGKTVINY